MRGSSAFILPLALSILAWAVLCASIPPSAQDFPLADDWNFARGCFQFAGGEGVHYGQWAAMTLVGQWLWATPFVWFFGASHFVLRVSTIVLSWIGLWACYDLFRQQGIAPRLAALATATLAFHPVFFLLQGTFMTDVPALSFSLIALTLFVRAFATAGRSLLIAAGAAAILAGLTRQTAMTVPLAAAILLWQQPRLRRRLYWWAGVLLPLAIDVGAHLWLQRRPDVIQEEVHFPTNHVALARSFVLIHFCGLAAVPLLLLDLRPSSWIGVGLFSVPILAGAAYWMSQPSFTMTGGLFPYADGIWTRCGAYMPEPGRAIVLPESIQVVLTVLGCLGAGGLCWRLADQLRLAGSLPPLVIFSLLQVPLVLGAKYMFDRYLLGLLPGALAVAATGAVWSNRKALPAIALVAVSALCSICFMHDWLACNAARWTLGVRSAAEENIQPAAIRGNFEWTAWWGGTEERFKLALVKHPGYAIRATEPFVQWLPPGHRQMLLLEPSDDEPDGQ
jgi:hypothetical protein